MFKKANESIKYMCELPHPRFWKKPTTSLKVVLRCGKAFMIFAMFSFDAQRTKRHKAMPREAASLQASVEANRIFPWRPLGPQTKRRARAEEA